MIGWRKKSWNPEWVSSLFTFVCVSVCLSVHVFAGYMGHIWIYFFWGWRHFFRNFIFYTFYWRFSMLSLYNTSRCSTAYLQQKRAQFEGKKYHSWNNGCTLHNAFDSRFSPFIVPQYFPQVYSVQFTNTNIHILLILIKSWHDWTKAPP